MEERTDWDSMRRHITNKAVWPGYDQLVSSARVNPTQLVIFTQRDQ